MSDRVLTDEQVYTITERYLNGETSTFLAKEYGVSQDTISKWIKKQGVSMRTSGESMSAGLNDNYFGGDLDEHAAYWLGFISADGHIVVKNEVPAGLRIFLSSVDRDMLEKFAEDINYKGTIKDYTRTKNGKKYYESGITFRSRKLCSDLDHLGVLQWKNGNSKILDEMNPDLRRHFIRGLFDGDGCITATKRKDRPSLTHKITIVDNKSNVDPMKSVEKYISLGSGASQNGVKIRKTTCSLVWVGRKQVANIGKWMYSNATIFMGRKKIKFPDHALIECCGINNHNRYHYSNWKQSFESAEACVEWLLAYGFHPPEYEIDSSNIDSFLNVEDTLNANVNCPKILDVIRHFSGHYWHSTHNGYNPPSAVWESGNQSILHAATNKIWDKKLVNIHTLLRAIKRHYKDFTVVSIFKPWVARHVCKMLLPNGGTVIDPCMGWGGRLIGCVDLDIDYIGYDLNKLAISSHVAIKKFLGGRIKSATFKNADASKIEWPQADLLFTSPPYDNTELYHGINSHNTLTEPIVKNILQFPGRIALNVPLRNVKMCQKLAIAAGRELVDKLEMKTSSFQGREKTYEPILIYK